ncbi:uncharacterized protein LOC127797273 isoform X7 [Diospyros lotus]|uniref:uncharacterized protein LOC127797273 isoform X6 n=1 Tax=Diospyros lotus TaxID=55363 RepID=UPI002257AFE4|nr:uncharacterized protein LOC127797273 isoform X6 [Diospyros lotus]XP_052185982.1 uncharacterized protein LOC127797273 isoform X7 [Diospyros lotus]
MRVNGQLQNHHITILIGNGSTHNFLDQTVGKRLGLLVECSKPLQVVVANREKIDCSGQCKGLSLTIHNCSIRADFYFLALAACQAVLGVQWLETLGPIEANYRDMTMSFEKDGRLHKLQGIRKGPSKALRDKELLNLEGAGFFFQIILDPPTYSPQELAGDLNELHMEFNQVIGLDFSKEQLSLASSRQHLYSKACYNNIKWVEGNALDLPFSDCHFDAVTMGYGLRNVIDKRKAMEEIYRILKPGSKASVLDFNKSTNTLLASIEDKNLML